MFLQCCENIIKIKHCDLPLPLFIIHIFLYSYISIYYLSIPFFSPSKYFFNFIKIFLFCIEHFLQCCENKISYIFSFVFFSLSLHSFLVIFHIYLPLYALTLFYKYKTINIFYIDTGFFLKLCMVMILQKMKTII